MLLLMRRLVLGLLGRVVRYDRFLPTVALSKLVDLALIIFPALDRVPVIEKIRQVDARDVPGGVENPVERRGLKLMFLSRFRFRGEAVSRLIRRKVKRSH